MSTIPFLALPHSLLDDPLLKNLHPFYKEILQVILKNLAFRPQKFNDFGKIYDIFPGEVCMSLNEIANLCSKFITKKHVENCLNLLKKWDIFGTRRANRRNIITIRHLDTYAMFNRSEKVSLGQVWDIKEDIKIYKKENIKRKKPDKPVSDQAAELLIFFSSSLKENIPEVKKPVDPTTAKYFDQILKDYTPEEIKKAILYCHRDPFWSSKVLTVNYLKTKFVRLLASSNRDIKGKKTTIDQSQFIDTQQIVDENRAAALRYIESNWNILRERELYMDDRVNYVKMGNDELYYDNFKFKELFKHNLGKMLS